MAGISTFRTDDARTEYCRLYDETLALSPLPVTELDVEGSFGRTHLLTAGYPSKPPLVGLHGKSFSATSWLPLLPTLAADNHVTLLDTVGDVNKSVASRPVANADDAVAWLDETLRSLTIGRATLVGLSMGSWLAAHYAMTHPDRVERLAMISPVGLVSNQHARWLFGAMRTMAVRPTEKKIDRFLGSMAMPASRPRLHQPPWHQIFRQFVVGSLSFRNALVVARPIRCNLQGLAAADIPILAMVGADETLHDGPGYAERLRERLPNAQVELIRDANHLLPVDQPEMVDGLLCEFLS